MENIKSEFNFERYYVSKINFERNDNFNFDKTIDINFELDHDCVLDNDKMHMKLYLTVFPDAVANDYPFTIEICLNGDFRVNGEMDERLQANAIAILYPYARAIVSTYTAQANVPALILPPINVIKYLDFKNNGTPRVN